MGKKAPMPPKPPAGKKVQGSNISAEGMSKLPMGSKTLKPSGKKRGGY